MHRLVNGPSVATCSTCYVKHNTSLLPIPYPSSINFVLSVYLPPPWMRGEKMGNTTLYFGIYLLFFSFWGFVLSVSVLPAIVFFLFT
ncbi:hypothetical protein EDB85DRAFT_1967117, partial [Lactarius pseudohatsudake]